MTAVIGMLNKTGVAIAADSAVTRTRGVSRKVTKNGNKMVRLSNLTPISVMITGNAMFLHNPWDIIIRKYRQERGGRSFTTVEAAVMDLIGYLSKYETLWTPEIERSWLRNRVAIFMDKLSCEVSPDVQTADSEGHLTRPRAFVKQVLKSLKDSREFFVSANQGFKDYDFGRFKDLLRPYLDDYLNEEYSDVELKNGLKENMEELEEELFRGMYSFITWTAGEGTTTLVFTGYGIDEVYPSLIAVNIKEGFDHHVNWEMTQKVNIDDETPSAICPFAQKDVITALLWGASSEWLTKMDQKLKDLCSPEALMGDDMQMEDIPGWIILNNVTPEKLLERHFKSMKKEIRNNRNRWIKDLEGYDVKSMAHLAMTLIELTGLQRILTFQQEGVGGEVDLAVITKTDGFTWLSRKSWYHHKDIGGRYGSLGI